jgi:hypothetical protein
VAVIITASTERAEFRLANAHEDGRGGTSVADPFRFYAGCLGFGGQVLHTLVSDLLGYHPGDFGVEQPLAGISQLATQALRFSLRAGVIGIRQVNVPTGNISIMTSGNRLLR